MSVSIRRYDYLLTYRISAVVDEEHDLSRTIAHLQRRKNDLEVKREYIEYEREHDLQQYGVSTTRSPAC
jgi:hypothetical protein